ncbi:hypothetical protein KV097_04460 [Mumia sp. zg.B17]|nr:hypothetical protein [Mumia sp. zg.B17]MBW9205186.1 hypothetical protein [Mumia sp. zg.B17]
MYNTLLNAGYLPVGEGGIPPGVVQTDTQGNRIINPDLYDPKADVDPDLKDDFNRWLATAPSGLAQEAINSYASNLPSFR